MDPATSASSRHEKPYGRRLTKQPPSRSSGVAPQSVSPLEQFPSPKLHHNASFTSRPVSGPLSEESASESFSLYSSGGASNNTEKPLLHRPTPLASHNSEKTAIDATAATSLSEEAKPPTTAKKTSFSRFVNSVLGSPKKVEISGPSNLVHLTHVGFNFDTGEFTGLPKEWQRMLQESEISKNEQEQNPQAAMNIVAF